MTDKPQNEPEFPFQPVEFFDDSVKPCQTLSVSLRDIFAAKAMQALITIQGRQGVGPYSKQDIANEAYRYADVMLIERDKGQAGGSDETVYERL